MKTKLVALDVYGTFLDSEDYENACPPRKGFEEFAERCLALNLKLVTASDADRANLMTDLDKTFKNSRHDPKPTLEIFDGFYRLTNVPKDFSKIISYYQINPEELFVIGDTYEKDIAGAKALGCSTLHVIKYGDKSVDDSFFDFRNVTIP